MTRMSSRKARNRRCWRSAAAEKFWLEGGAGAWGVKGCRCGLRIGRWVLGAESRTSERCERLPRLRRSCD